MVARYSPGSAESDSIELDSTCINNDAVVITEKLLERLKDSEF
jgi:hypothetical protein